MTATDTATPKHDIVAFENIPVDRVVPNTLNPRPEFHLSEEDPDFLALRASIEIDGQHRPCAVFEQVGHWSLPDRPGTFVLLQGERRWRSVAGSDKIELLKCVIHPTPANEAQELELLSVEDAHRLPWQPFFEMRHAAHLAEVYGVPVAHADIVNKTGLSMDQLRTAEKMFKLAPAVIAKVEEYERSMYEQRKANQRRERSRWVGQNRRQVEFTPQKAALVYDIFVALRTYATITVQGLNDEELQLRIADMGLSTPELDSFLSSVKSAGAKPPPLLLSQIKAIISDPTTSTARTVVRGLGASKISQLAKFATRLDRITDEALKLSKFGAQFGNDEMLLLDIRSRLTKATQALDRLERTVEDRRREVSNG